jgi:predicted phosphodiesterase
LGETQCVIYGHSHKYEEKQIDGVFYLNPGSCGPRRFHQDITMAVMTVEEDGTFQVQRIDIPHESDKKEKGNNL